MAYTPNYTSADMSAITVDFIASVGVEGVAFAGIVFLLLIGTWAKTKVNKITR